ncbi:hypothetical protein Golob_012842, partial [Gossypium lobatum]|nr:hypothetical protein [Gossypium lobatum]
MIPDKILYRYGDFDWVPLLGIWGAVGYAPPLVLRQYRSRQFIPAMQGLAQCEFPYKGDNYKKKGKRVNDNVPSSSQESTRPIEEHLQVIPSELEILEEEKMRRGLDIDIQKLKAEKIRKEKNKVEEDLDSLKNYYKKLRLSIRTAGLVELLEMNNEHWKKQFQCSQGQMKDRDHIMSEAVTQVREIIDRLQAVAVQ